MSWEGYFYMRKNKHIDHVIKTAFQRHKLLKIQTSLTLLEQWTTRYGSYAVLSRSEIRHYPENLNTSRHWELVKFFLCSSTIPITPLNVDNTNLALQSTP